jgi:hypothetical protein
VDVVGERGKKSPFESIGGVSESTVLLVLFVFVLFVLFVLREDSVVIAVGFTEDSGVLGKLTIER